MIFRIQNLNFVIQVSGQFEVIHVNESYLPVHMLFLLLLKNGDAIKTTLKTIMESKIAH